ncbi:MAG: hypothetical protein F4X77_01090 [Acidobacteriia bacterium]|nr:hypothetical protein [Terriglobia bacterium]
MTSVLALAGCTSGTEGEVAQVEWIPYSYWAVFDEDGAQTGWVLAEFGLEAGPPPWQDSGGGIVETPLDFEIERREVRMDMDWVPPQGLAEGGPSPVLEPE